MSKPQLLDLFCGAGGAAMGYHHAGFEVVGVDINPQPRYPFRFIQADAFEMVRRFAADAIHASPPCQAYSYMANCRPGLAKKYEALVALTRVVLQASGTPWVIENVPGAPLIDPIVLCGTMFGRELYRHRLFEASFPLIEPVHFEHMLPASKAGHWRPGTVMSVAGHFAPVTKAREIMGIDWMTRDELAEAIPPAYTEYIGRQLMEVLQ